MCGWESFLPRMRYKKNSRKSCSKKYAKKLVVLFSMQDDPIGNINLAMEIAEKHLDIPKMLDAEGEMKIVFFGLQKICCLPMLRPHIKTCKRYSQVTSEGLRIPKKFLSLASWILENFVCSFCSKLFSRILLKTKPAKLQWKGWVKGSALAKKQNALVCDFQWKASCFYFNNIFSF